MIEDRRKPTKQIAIALRWPRGAAAPPARLVRALVRSTTWRGGLSFLARVKQTWAPDLLLLDIDQATPPRLLDLRARLTTMGLQARMVEYSRTTHGWHVIITLRQRLTLAEAIAAQAILGSDHYREAFNFARARSAPGAFWRARANILFAEKLR
jgi:hypothetical protein